MGEATLDRVVITGGDAHDTIGIFGSDGGGLAAFGNNLTLRDVAVQGNRAELRGGGLAFIDADEPTLSNVTVISNTASLGGGITFMTTKAPALTNVILRGNTALSDGGALYSADSSPRLINTLFNGNQATRNGDALYTVNTLGSDTILTNATFGYNSAGALGGAIYNERGAATVQNSIIWNNVDQTGTVSASIVNTDEATTLVHYSVVEASGGSNSWNSSAGTDGGNNFDADPLFMATDDLRLSAGSPAVNTGDNGADLDGTGPASATISDIATDLDGVARIRNGIVDMGAYESDYGEAEHTIFLPLVIRQPVAVAREFLPVILR